MAYASLVSLSQTIHKLQSNQDLYPISTHENQQIMSIHKHVIFVQAFLENYSDKASRLEGRMRDAANTAEDIIEYFMWKKIDQRNYNTELPHQRDIRCSLNRLFNRGEIHLGQNCFDFKILKKVAQEIESIAAEVKEIQNSARAKDVQQLTYSSSAVTSSSRLIVASTGGKSDTEMVGFQDKLMAMKERLCGESPKLQVIPIFGMGGMGKTTLAKSAYDDQLIVEHFDIRAWVTVSQDYNTPQIMSSLIISVGAKYEARAESEAGAEGSERSKELKMAEIVYKHLKGRRYLIVMNDMWCTKALDDVRRIFPDDRNGSHVVLTTRLLDVATYPDSSSPLHARFMDDEESWNLLRKQVFQGGNCPPQLKDVGKTIAQSCRGLPLAIVVIAGLLSTVSQTPNSWKNIRRNVIEAVTKNDEQFAEVVLSLSYDNLPHHLRPCFLYMGIFPEDYEIRVSKLIRLWVAEGFLKLPNGSKSCEEVAEEYLEDLIKRSLILVTMRNYTGKIKRCGMHDLVRDLCIRKAQQEKFLVHVEHTQALQESMINQRWVSITASANLGNIECIYDSPIHSIICTKKANHNWDECAVNCLPYAKLLRVLDVRDQHVWRYPITAEFFHVSTLFHLRYLCLPQMFMVPEHISNLENLQTLIIHGEQKSYADADVIHLEFEVWRMLQLRHLVSSRCFDGLPNPEAGRFPLENLQTLLQVKNFICTEEVLLMIPNLKKLGICYSEDKSAVDFRLQNFQYLHQLEKLTLQFRWPVFLNSEQVKPAFPTTLKKLTLSGCALPWKDLGFLVGLLPNLEVLKLRSNACDGDKWETSEGEFLQLKFLEISQSGIQEWITECSHFPSLKWLVLRHCICLRQIPDDIGEISSLELIEVDDENKSLLGSAKRLQEEQQDLENDALQFHFIRS